MNNPAVSTTVKGKTTIDRSIDDINADGIGFGIKGTNPDQASQVNHNEAFSVEFEEATDLFTFGVQGIGNNAKSVDIYYDVGVDANNDGVLTQPRLLAPGGSTTTRRSAARLIKPAEISRLFSTAHRDKGMDIAHVRDGRSDPVRVQLGQRETIQTAKNKTWQDTAGVRITGSEVAEQ